jgi:uncharacterized protein (UPF0333 family)
MSKKGQITVEAILLFGIFIIILVSVSFPMAMKARKHAIEVTVVSDARYASEQIVTAANRIAYPGGRRTIEIYVPASRGKNITTSISTDGSNLITTVSIPGDTPKIINLSLYGDNWAMYNASSGSSSNITETSGARYRFVITWKSINFTRLG